MSEDVAPENMGRKKKDTTVYDRNENEGVIMSCPFCGEAFIRRSNRAMTCGKPECTRARKRLNKKNSRQKQKILHSKASSAKSARLFRNDNFVEIKANLCFNKDNKVARCKNGQI